MPIIKCEICKREFHRKPSISSASRFCSRSCQGISKRIENKGANSGVWKGGAITKECAICGKEFNIKSYRKNSARFCSSKCFGKSLKIERLNVCIVCGKQYNLQEKYNNPSTSKFCSRQCQFSPSSPFVVQKRADLLKGLKSQGGKVSKFETQVADDLTSLGINYSPQVPFGNFLADFYLPDFDAVLECDGDFWHSRTQERDARKDAYIRSKGTKVIRIKLSEYGLGRLKQCLMQLSV